MSRSGAAPWRNCAASRLSWPPSPNASTPFAATLRRADAAIAAIGQRIAGANELAQSSDAINAGLRQLDSARAELERLESARREYDNLRTRRNELQSAIDREHAELSAEASQLERRIREELQPMAGRGGHIASQLAAVTETEQSLTGEQDIIDAQTAASAELQGSIAVQQGELARCIAEGKELRAKQTEMQSADALCPLCRTPLSEDACGNINAWYQSELMTKLQRHGEIKQIIDDLSNRHTRLTSDTESRRQSLTGRQRQAQQQRGRLEQEQRQSDDAGRQLESLQPRLAALQKALAAGDFANDHRSAPRRNRPQYRCPRLRRSHPGGGLPADPIVAALGRQAARFGRRALPSAPTMRPNCSSMKRRRPAGRMSCKTPRRPWPLDQSAVADLPAREAEAQFAEAALARLSG